MKYLLIIPLIIPLIFFSSCVKKESNAKTGKLEVVPVYCKYDINENHLSSDFKLFKKGGNKVEIKVTDKNVIPGTNKSVISNLEYGDYYIEFKTIYNQKETVKFEINQSQIKTIKLCFDHLDYESNKNILFLDELKNGDSFIIFHQSQGCFHFVEDKIEIIKYKNAFFAKYKGTKYTLTKSQIKTLKEFEIELRSNHGDGCTTVDTYTIYNHREGYTMSDGSCQWRGFSNLISLLKLKK